METIKLYSVTKNFFLLLLTTAMILSFESCVTRTKLVNSAIVPAAEGVVKVRQDKNNNYVINISIANLARPTDLQPPKNAYVVWMEAGNNETKNIGQIKSSTFLFSKSLKGSFESVSSEKPKKIFISAEDDPKVQYPDNSDIVLTTNYLKN